ncbi:hypothetical protein GCM10010275_34460 [Streptomyces litmocidini]|uniref:hypothetical protein n=1 Tax=Streptomyces litmocidini TaxID=67318 RepID=UPI0019CA4380|nr:hypothetical protein [Streptomyces litmocidini]GGU94159.1 hypothetical protein GCM10010275_34460 [Streptomyces litmocidini]
MGRTRSKARHRRRGKPLTIGLPAALAAAGAPAHGTAFGLFGADARPRAGATTAPAGAREAADGFASVDALGQKGTYGGRDGATATVRNLADLEKHATAPEPYAIRDSVPGATVKAAP